jgi:hypothetical protein
MLHILILEIPIWIPGLHIRYSEWAVVADPGSNLLQAIEQCLGPTQPIKWSKGKGKILPRTGHEAQRGVEVQPYSFFNRGARWGGWSTPCSGRFTPW